MKLDGRRIVITRAVHQSEELTNLIKEAGGIAVNYPCIEIAPPDNTAQLDSALRNFRNYDWIIFTSSNTVHAVQNRIQALQLTLDWSKIRIAVLGSKTGESLVASLGVQPDFIPSIHTGSVLAEEMPLSPEQTILLPQSALAEDDLSAQLIEREAIVTSVEAYKNIVATGGEDVPTLLQQNQVDAITFTSSSTVTNFGARIAPLEALHIPAVCIGSSTYETAIEAGFENAYFPENYSINAMFELLLRLFNEVTHGNT